MNEFIKEYLMVIFMIVIVASLYGSDFNVPVQFNNWVKTMSFGF